MFSATKSRLKTKQLLGGLSDRSMNSSTSAIERQFRNFEFLSDVVFSRLRTVIIRNNITAAAFFHIARALGRNNTLLNLDLGRFLGSPRMKANREVLHEVFECIIRDIFQSKSLKVLVLDDSVISDKTALLISQGLKKTTITNFSMVNCHFETADAVFTLLQALYNNFSIKNLDLFGSIVFEQREEYEMLAEWRQVLLDRLTIDDVTAEICVNQELLATLEDFNQFELELLENDKEDLRQTTRGEPTKKLAVKESKEPEISIDGDLICQRNPKKLGPTQAKNKYSFQHIADKKPSENKAAKLSRIPILHM